MANIKSVTINSIAVIFAILFIIGALNAVELVPMIRYANDHLGGYMSMVVFGSLALALFLLPIAIGYTIEVRMYESNTKIGYEIACAMWNVRNSWLSFAACGIGGGLVLAASLWGAFTIIYC